MIKPISVQSTLMQFDLNNFPATLIFIAPASSNIRLLQNSIDHHHTMSPSNQLHPFRSITSIKQSKALPLERSGSSIEKIEYLMPCALAFSIE